MTLGMAETLRLDLLGNGFLHNAAVESFAIHSRNPIDFLHLEKPKPSDVIASDYFSDTRLWSDMRPALSDNLQKAKGKANKQIAHLTYDRLTIPEDEAMWQFVLIADESSRFFFNS